MRFNAYAATALVVAGRLATGDRHVLQMHVGAETLYQQHTAGVIRVDGDACTAVDGDIGVCRELTAGENDGATLDLGRELYPVGGRAVGVRQRQRLPQGQHAIVGRDVARARDDEGCGGGLGSGVGLVQLEGADIGMGVVRLGPRHVALVSGWGVGWVGAA